MNRRMGRRPNPDGRYDFELAHRLRASGRSRADIANSLGTSLPALNVAVSERRLTDRMREALYAEIGDYRAPDEPARLPDGFRFVGWERRHPYSARDELTAPRASVDLEREDARAFVAELLWDACLAADSGQCNAIHPERYFAAVVQCLMGTMTFRAASKEFGVSLERVRQMTNKVLRNLRHPSRAAKLAEACEAYGYAPAS